MSLPAPGNYYIVNLFPTSDLITPQLAINFNGAGSPLTVTPYENLSSQVWEINNFDSKTQTISPKDVPGLRVAFGNDHSLTTLYGAYTWIINGNYLYTIQDGQSTIFWDLNMSTPGTEVTYSTQFGNPTQFWGLYSA